MPFIPSAYGFMRVGVAAPELRVGDVDFNCAAICRTIEEAAGQGCFFLVFPELCVTSYSCGDLFLQPLLLEAARHGIRRIAETTGRLHAVAVIGAPLRQDGRLFNAAFFLADGRVRGIVPKIHLPNTMEFYEERWFTSGREIRGRTADWFGEAVPFGVDLLFEAEGREGCRIGIEICEDLWVPAPPSAALAQAGATVLVNPSASPELLAKEQYRRDLVRSQSARCLAAYLLATAGPGESSTDLVFSGHSLIAENGTVLAETERFRFDSQLAVADLDLEKLLGERLRRNTFGAAASPHPYRVVPFPWQEQEAVDLRRPISPTPFVPSGEGERTRRCREIFALQTTGLAKRLFHTGLDRAVIGVSGGIDSTLALLVTAKAFDRLGFGRQRILAVTMPGFGTTGRTRNNAEQLAMELGVELRTIPIEKAVREHFRDIGHPEERHDITFENAQARERTQILMDLANQVNGLVIGTGDLSELALGWCTFNGDHMSMYAVNAGVPKTLVRYVVSWAAETEFSGRAAEVLNDIRDTPVSPELLPVDAQGENPQHTEREIGPYLLHDFFLYHAVRLQFPPRKILLLAEQAFGKEFRDEELRHWLVLFYRRFFSQQFKRSCLPDGPKIGSVALSPRGDWRMPSDACVELWLTELKQTADPASS
ncbi:MAG: NAD(+) synthase [Deltaproteobacteria bacterium]|nr:NAD(+) synthase [Deltaproteobacteria bacterium]